MADISACSGVKEKVKCPLRHNCKRHEVHLNSTGKIQSYIKAVFVGQSCEFVKE